MNANFNDKAKMEVNVNDNGVSFVGNAEGYRSLADFFTHLAKLHDEIRTEPLDDDTNSINGYGAYHFTHYIPERAIKESRFIFSPGPLNNNLENKSEMDILFWVSDAIGPDFWRGVTESKATDEWVENSSFMAIKE